MDFLPRHRKAALVSEQPGLGWPGASCCLENTSSHHSLGWESFPHCLHLRGDGLTLVMLRIPLWGDRDQRDLLLDGGWIKQLHSCALLHSRAPQELPGWFSLPGDPGALIPDFLVFLESLIQ